MPAIKLKKVSYYQVSRCDDYAAIDSPVSGDQNIDIVGEISRRFLTHLRCKVVLTRKIVKELRGILQSEKVPRHMKIQAQTSSSL